MVVDTLTCKTQQQATRCQETQGFHQTVCVSMQIQLTQPQSTLPCQWRLYQQSVVSDALPALAPRAWVCIPTPRWTWRRARGWARPVPVSQWEWKLVGRRQWGLEAVVELPCLCEGSPRPHTASRWADNDVPGCSLRLQKSFRKGRTGKPSPVFQMGG